MGQGRTARLLGALTLLLVIALGSPIPLGAQPAPTATVRTQTAIEFPGGMRFTAEIPVAGDDIDHVDLLYRLGADETLYLTAVPGTGLTRAGNALTVDVFVDMQESFVPMGVELTFHWELSAGGTVVQATPDETAMWIDNRFDWTTIESDQVTLHSYEASDAFARRMLDNAQATIDELETRFALDRIAPISVWVYASGEDMSGTRQANSREAVAGLSYLDSGTTAVIIPDGNESELGRVLPHEISHLVLDQATRNPFSTPPLWFNEGLATHVQVGGTGHYPGIVARAEASGGLYDIASLEVSFPYAAEQVTLAYASSWSMVAYIEETFGDNGIARLIAAFGSGQPTADAVETALGVTPESLNAAWHAWVRVKATPAAIAA
ncbi:MAG TPA: peptidase MA family metallohydrolase [Thermomicrobiales bacterium]|nr:peptidase MA family metallohydrolase [Thermomicrobiales bacterium]